METIGLKLALLRAILGISSERRKAKLLSELLTTIYDGLYRTHIEPEPGPVLQSNRRGSAALPEPGSLSRSPTRMATYARFLALTDHFPEAQIEAQMRRSGVEAGKEYQNQFGTITDLANLLRLFQLGDLILGTHPVDYTLTGARLNEDKHVCLLHDAVSAAPTTLACSKLCTPFIGGLLEGMGYGPSDFEYHRWPGDRHYCNRTIICDGFKRIE